MNGIKARLITGSNKFGYLNQMRLLLRTKSFCTTAGTSVVNSEVKRPGIPEKYKQKSKFRLINWVYDDILKSKIKFNSFVLYSKMTDQIDYNYFFKTFKMDDTYNSWFLITELHMWLLLARIRREDKDGQLSSKTITSALWDDCTSRAKVLSPADSSTSKKQLQTLGDEFKTTLLLYDEGLLSTDAVLTSALWYRFFNQSCDDPRLLELLVAYVRHQMNNLDKTPVEEILLRTNLKWIPLSPAVLKSTPV